MAGHDSEPLLAQPRNIDENETNTWQNIQACRTKGQRILNARMKHYIVMSLVAIDVITLLANVFVQLIACERDQSDERWVHVVDDVFETIGLVISCVFMLELTASLFCFGLSYLSSWSNLFDSLVIVTDLVLDIISRGPAQSIGDLVVLLRLWRLAKISEELILGASERIRMLEMRLDRERHENDDLKAQLGQNQLYSEQA